MSESIPKIDMADNPTGCCPRFDPALWDGKEFNFGGKRFVSAKTRSFFYMPLNMAPVMKRVQAAAEAAGAVPKDRYLMLSKEASPWGATHLVLAEKDVPGHEMSEVSGTWYAKVFEGPFSKVGSWYKEMNGVLKRKNAESGIEETDILAFYTTCPACAKAYGKNYVVLFGRVG